VRRHARGRARARPAPLAVCLALLAALPAATAQEVPLLPPAATPGGAFPELPDDEALPRPPPDSAFPVPPAVERPLGEDEGDRLFVEKFVVSGVESRPEKGVVADELQQLVERLRVERQGLDEVGEDGFTPEEKQQITAFMREVVESRDLDVNFEEYAALVDRLRSERAERRAGLTIGQLQQVANAVTEYYRSAGFILAQAYIPAQEVVDGVVVIEVLEGKLGNVLVEGNEGYSDRVLAKPFEGLIDAPVTADAVEASILTMGDLPGLSAFGVFRPGATTGTADMVLRVQDEDPWSVSVRHDNHGTRFTGRRRTLVDLTVNNPTGAGDVLRASGLKALDPRSSLFYSFDYERPVLTPRTSVGAGFLRNTFDVLSNFAELGISGETRLFNAFIRHQVVRSREANLGATLRFNRKKDLTVQEGVGKLAQDDIAFLEGEVAFDNIDFDAQAINQGTFGFGIGLGNAFGGRGKDVGVDERAVPPSRVVDSGKFASSDFWKIYGSLSRLQQLRYSGQSVLVRLEGQFSNSLLVPSEQFSVGGPANVRALPIAEILADSALYGSLEWNINAPFIADRPAFKNLTWGEVLRVSFFTDYAVGMINEPGDEDETPFNVGGYGAGIQLTVPGSLTARFQWAHLIGDTEPSDPREDHSRYWLDFTYTF